MEEYESFFGDAFPTFCFTYLSTDEMIQIIDECLEAEKDVYEMGYLKNNLNVKY